MCAIKLVVEPELVKYLSSLNDSKLYWIFDQIIFSAGFAGKGGLS